MSHYTHTHIVEVELRRRGEQSTHKWTHLWMVLFELRLLPSLYLLYIHVIAKVHESHLQILPTNRVKLPIPLELKSTIPATVLQTGRDEKKGAVPVPIQWQKRDERAEDYLTLAGAKGIAYLIVLSLQLTLRCFSPGRGSVLWCIMGSLVVWERRGVWCVTRRSPACSRK